MQKNINTEMKSLVLMFFALCFSFSCYSQISFVFVPEINGKTVNGLGVFQMINLGSIPVNGDVTITVSENKNRANVVVIKIPNITIKPGNNTIPASAFVNASFRFSNTAVGNIASQIRNFPAGDYSYCFVFEDMHSSGDNNESCFDALIQPLVPISLIYPGESDTLCSKRPHLSWQPPIPYNASMRYRLLLTDKKRGASIENLLMNTPLVLQDNIPSTSISFPSLSPDLKEGVTYCWQVIAHQNGMIISQSEPWEFTVSCSEPAAISPQDSYRELKLMVNGNYYIANRFFKFSFVNNYNVSKLKYTIISLDNGKTVKRIPEVKMQRGLNKIDIDLTDSDLEIGKHYLIKVYPFNEPAIEVRFVYMDI